MENKEPCNFCREWYRPVEIQPGVSKLQIFTTTIEYTAFDSPKGQALLMQMHEQATEIATR